MCTAACLTTVVAVKKLTNVVQGEEEFWAEMTVFGRINRINLVRIWGFCSEEKHKLFFEIETQVVGVRVCGQ